MKRLIVSVFIGLTVLAFTGCTKNSNAETDAKCSASSKCDGATKCDASKKCG